MVKINNVIPILFSSIIMNGFMAIAPILAEIQKSFPDADSSEIQLIYTIISLSSMFTMILAGVLVHYFSKKSLMLAGILIMIIGGVLPSILHKSLLMLYVLSSLFGIGMGVFNIVNSTLISDYFKGVDKAKVMGIQSAMVSIGAAVLSSLSGLIAVRKNWPLSYLVFTICIPIFIFIFIALPKDPVAQRNSTGEKSISWRLVYFVILNLFASMCINVFHSNNAMFLETMGLGNAAIAGTVQFVFMLVGIPCGLSLGFCMKHLGRNTMGFSTLSIAAGMFFIAFSHSLLTVYLGAFLIGAGFAIRAPGSIIISANMAPLNSAAMAIGLNNSFGSIGNFISPIVINPIAEKIGNKPSIHFLLSGNVLLMLSLFYFFINPVREENEIVF
jgi:MFS family permease